MVSGHVLQTTSRLVLSKLRLRVFMPSPPHTPDSRQCAAQTTPSNWSSSPSQIPTSLFSVSRPPSFGSALRLYQIELALADQSNGRSDSRPPSKRPRLSGETPSPTSFIQINTTPTTRMPETGDLLLPHPHIPFAPPFMSNEQRAIVQLVLKGHSIFFTGSAGRFMIDTILTLSTLVFLGTGKSVLLNMIIDQLSKKYGSASDQLAVTASTGILPSTFYFW